MGIHNNIKEYYTYMNIQIRPNLTIHPKRTSSPIHSVPDP